MALIMKQKGLQEQICCNLGNQVYRVSFAGTKSLHRDQPHIHLFFQLQYNGLTSNDTSVIHRQYPVGRSLISKLLNISLLSSAFPFSLLTGSQFFMSREGKHKKVQQTQLQDKMTYGTYPIDQAQQVSLFLVLSTVRHFSLCMIQ